MISSPSRNGALRNRRPARSAVANSKSRSSCRGKAWRTIFNSLLVHLLGEVALAAELFHEVEVRFEPIDGVLLVLQDLLEQGARSVVALRNGERDAPVPAPDRFLFEHPVVDEILIDGRELGREHFVQKLQNFRVAAHAVIYTPPGVSRSNGMT